MGVCFFHYISHLAPLLKPFSTLLSCDSLATVCWSPGTLFLGEENSPSFISTSSSNEELLAATVALDFKDILVIEKGKQLTLNTSCIERTAAAFASQRMKHRWASMDPMQPPPLSHRPPDKTDSNRSRESVSPAPRPGRSPHPGSVRQAVRPIKRSDLELLTRRQESGTTTTSSSPLLWIQGTNL